LEISLCSEVSLLDEGPISLASIHSLEASLKLQIPVLPIICPPVASYPNWCVGCRQPPKRGVMDDNGCRAAIIMGKLYLVFVGHCREKCSV